MSALVGIHGFRVRAENLCRLNAFLLCVSDPAERKRLIVLLAQEGFISDQAAELLIDHHGLVAA